MRRVVFYSWQSDLPNATNRGLIQSALEIAAEAIADDDTVAVEPVVDRDTEGVAGSPEIASTIFSKIDAADIVVADVSIIGEQSAKRQGPNPNGMIEVGYALNLALGRRRGTARVLRPPTRSSLTADRSRRALRRKRGPAPEGKRRDGASKGAAPWATRVRY